MSRARDLLPLLATADHELQQRVSNEPPSTMDIENVTEDEPHIEMVGGELYVKCFEYMYALVSKATPSNLKRKRSQSA